MYAMLITNVAKRFRLTQSRNQCGFGFIADLGDFTSPLRPYFTHAGHGVQEYRCKRQTMWFIPMVLSLIHCSTDAQPHRHAEGLRFRIANCQ